MAAALDAVAFCSGATSAACLGTSGACSGSTSVFGSGMASTFRSAEAALFCSKPSTGLGAPSAKSCFTNGVSRSDTALFSLGSPSEEGVKTVSRGLTNCHPLSFSESESSVTPSASGMFSGIAPMSRTGAGVSSTATFGLSCTHGASWKAATFCSRNCSTTGLFGGGEDKLERAPNATSGGWSHGLLGSSNGEEIDNPALSRVSACKLAAKLCSPRRISSNVCGLSSAAGGWLGVSATGS